MAGKHINENEGKEFFCLNSHGPMAKVKQVEKVVFRGVELKIAGETYRCKICGLNAATQEQAGELQTKIADAYRCTKGLLTSAEIRSRRKELGMTQQELAGKIGAGIASIKRWEGGALQTPAMDNLLRNAFSRPASFQDVLTGNRKLSLSRLKLVISEFEKQLGRKLLVEGDKMLFTAKYTFYADMLAGRYLGRSMTGATYAALPHGPQLNNYNELVDAIRAVDENEAEPLESEEKSIIEKIAEKWPGNWDVFNAAHGEEIVKTKQVGTLFYYTDANKLTQI